MNIISPSFRHQHEIPFRYTCDGLNTSPPIRWSDVPPNAKSLVMIVDDPDAPDPSAPKMTWVHWLLYNIPCNANGLNEDINENDLPPGTLQGLNDWHKIGYAGPCPPVGQHRYFFKLYALDIVLSDLKKPDKSALEKAMHEHIVTQATLLGLYRRFAGR